MTHTVENVSLTALGESNPSRRMVLPTYITLILKNIMLVCV